MKLQILVLSKRLTQTTDTIKIDGAMEDEETAKEKLKEAGFLEGNFTREERVHDPWVRVEVQYTPMAYFCSSGDLQMCRYLLNKGASTTKTTTEKGYFPMKIAAGRGHLDICKWLFNNGASADIKQMNYGLTPLGDAIGVREKESRVSLTRWLILNGAISRDSFGTIDQTLMRKVLRKLLLRDHDERPQLLNWAEDQLRNHHCFQVFLSGTLFPPAPPAFSTSSLLDVLSSRILSATAAQMLIANKSIDEQELIWEEMCRYQSTFSSFRGTSGIFELVADFAGIVRGRELRILRQLVPALQKYLGDTPYVAQK